MKSKYAVLLPTIMLMSVLMFSSIAEATVYNGYASCDEYWLFWYEDWEVWVTIDTDADTWTVRWDGPSSWMGCGYFGYYASIKLWDDKGYYEDLGPLYPLSNVGQVTYDYSTQNTWTYSEFQWVYAIDGFTFFEKTVRAAKYVGT